MNYISVKQAAENWGMSSRRVQVLCNQGRIDGAQRVGSTWTIPEIAQKPVDGRRKDAESHKVNSSIAIERVWAMPNKNTFDIKPIHDLIQEELTEGTWIDPFANRNKFASITNDLNTAYDTDYHMDALDFLRLFDNNSVDGVLYDPPYSPRQVSECYNDVGYNVTWDTTKASFWGNHKREISRIVKIGGKVITFGWNSGGIGYKYGFEIQRILLVPHGGWHNDTICTVEVKTHEGSYSSPIEERKMETVEKNVIPVIDTDEKLISLLKELPEEFWDFKESDTREYTHGLHSYPAMMVCPISRNIIKTVKQVMPIESLLDPFAGSGTVLVEGKLAGIPSVVGSDINPLAIFMSKVKTTNLDMDQLQAESQKLLDQIERLYLDNASVINQIESVLQEQFDLDYTSKEGWGTDAPRYLRNYCEKNALSIEIPSFKNIGYWFKPRVIVLLQIIKQETLKIESEEIRNFILLAFSETIRLVSNRRNGEFKMFRMPPQKVATFEPDVINEFMQILRRNIEKMNAFNEASAENEVGTSVSIYQDSAMVLDHLPNNSFDLVITSPPYGDSRTTVAYGEFSRLSLQWLNLFDLTEREIMGIDRDLMGGRKYRNGFEYTLESETLRQSLEKIKDVDIERAGDVYSFYSDLNVAIKAIAQKTRHGGYQFWVVGNRTVKNELLQTDIIIAELATQYGMDLVFSIARNISNKVMPSMNSPTNEAGKTTATMTTEHIIILRKRG